MPMHDWTRVRSGTYHILHYHWIAAIANRLNEGMLPPECFALPEQKVSGVEPDVVTLSARDGRTRPDDGGVALAPPNRATAGTGPFGGTGGSV